MTTHEQGDRDDVLVDIPANIGRPARGALAAAGYTTLAQVAATSERELLRLHGMGPKAIGRLREALAERGLAFADH
ncbi:helix-hairpin-helix domain-containing protein [Streptosporangium sp. NPDC002524]|uniref:helix-hairpin-helix domain-containing protein n=1 Tax=Streptosporangium sp. NPDC002524 TaxID=3154537 RepID=UPI00331AD40A